MLGKVAVLSLGVSAALWCGERGGLNPAVEQVVGAVSEERLAATLKKLESFGTRNTMSPGAVEARQWLADQFKTLSPRLQVSLDSYRVKKQGRVTRDIELANVVAVLPGTTHPERQIIVSGHYDTVSLAGPDWIAKQAEARAPGVDDDGSGTAAVLELARILSGREFPKTIVFVAFVGEEQGLLGSTLFAERARRENRIIEGVLNNDIIGTAVAGNGWSDTNTVRVFSEEPADSSSRELARYIREAAGRYLPSMRVELVFRADRFGRGGDHTPFNQQGYAAVRFTTANENYSHQHTINDTLENVSVPYLARVVKVNAAALTSLALAPPPPAIPGRGGLTRGASGYDADLHWQGDAADAGYAVLIRPSTAPYWQRSILVGKVNEYVMPNVSIDDIVLGVQAIDKDGNQSLVTPYVQTPYRERPIATW